MRARAFTGLILVVLTSQLVACGQKHAELEAGDVVQARLDDQFDGGRSSTVTLPIGRLLIQADDPVDGATADETRTREVVAAPEGAVLLPISWQYDPWASDRLDGIVATNHTPEVDLVSEGERYRLPPPERDAERGESFYVVVDGDAEDTTLEIEFDGVTQSVDLSSGAVDKDRAAALDDIDDEHLRKKSCDDEAWFDDRTVNADFVCDLVGPVLTPYAAGKWAPEGTLWLALTLTTRLRLYGMTDLLGSGAQYVAKSVKVRTHIDDDAPVFELSSNDESDICPSSRVGGCGSSRHLVFEVPEDDPEQGPLDVGVSYRLTLINSWGSWTPEERLRVTDSIGLKLWKKTETD
jgi:hypothetical protein